MVREGLEGIPCVRSLYSAVASGILGITRKSLPYRRDGKMRAVLQRAASAGFR